MQFDFSRASIVQTNTVEILCAGSGNGEEDEEKDE